MAKRPHPMDNNPTKASTNPPDAAPVDPSNSAETLLDLSGEEPSDNEMSDESLQNSANVGNTLSHPEAVLQGIDDRDTRAGRRSNELYDQAQLDKSTTGGDIYTNQYQAEVLGEEAVGGTTPTPDQDIVENLGASMGTDIPDRKPVNGRGMLERRDDKRWELDPQSSEDYEQHRP
ncbi:MAG: DUF6335 family protein [Synechococcales bacterium]|nr:DUF6335 family protein [Synechococcales bacterium]